MIHVPNIYIRIGALPIVECHRPLRSEGRVPRFDIADESYYNISPNMLCEWFRSNDLDPHARARAVDLCVGAAESLA